MLDILLNFIYKFWFAELLKSCHDLQDECKVLFAAQVI